MDKKVVIGGVDDPSKTLDLDFVLHQIISGFGRLTTLGAVIKICFWKKFVPPEKK
jgi:hypothetical protein